MRLFHVSEEPDIEKFIPRLPTRTDLDRNIGLVWAVDEKHLPNFLTPRDCPRVTWQMTEQTTAADQTRYFTSASQTYGIALENRWFEKLRSTTLYLYEFDPRDFALLDPVAGYYVAKSTQYPVARHRLEDLLGELFRRNVEVRFVDCLWEMAGCVRNSSLEWSLCRMKYAKTREKS